jgi:hypothetical protein
MTGTALALQSTGGHPKRVSAFHITESVPARLVAQGLGLQLCKPSTPGPARHSLRTRWITLYAARRIPRALGCTAAGKAALCTAFVLEKTSSPQDLVTSFSPCLLIAMHCALRRPLQGCVEEPSYSGLCGERQRERSGVTQRLSSASSTSLSSVLITPHHLRRACTWTYSMVF